MSRKRFLIIALPLLMLIGAGGVAFYFHLRAQAPPEFSEVDQFLHQIPTTSGWTFDHHNEEPAELPEGPGWLRRLGISGSGEVIRHIYSFVPAEGSGTMHVIFFQDGLRIRHFYYLDMTVAAAADFQSIVREKFPTLPRFELIE